MFADGALLTGAIEAVIQHLVQVTIIAVEEPIAAILGIGTGVRVGLPVLIRIVDRPMEVSLYLNQSLQLIIASYVDQPYERW